MDEIEQISELVLEQLILKMQSISSLCDAGMMLADKFGLDETWTVLNTVSNTISDHVESYEGADICE